MSIQMDKANVGKHPGVEIEAFFEDKAKSSVPYEDFPGFCVGACYVILKTEDNAGTLKQSLFLWVGQENDDRNKELAMQAAEELETSFSISSSMQIQGSENNAFKKIFPTIKYLDAEEAEDTAALGQGASKKKNKKKKAKAKAAAEGNGATAPADADQPAGADLQAGTPLADEPAAAPVEAPKAAVMPVDTAPKSPEPAPPPVASVDSPPVGEKPAMNGTFEAPEAAVIPAIDAEDSPMAGSGPSNGAAEASVAVPVCDALPPTPSKENGVTSAAADVEKISTPAAKVAAPTAALATPPATSTASKQPEQSPQPVSTPVPAAAASAPKAVPSIGSTSIAREAGAPSDEINMVSPGSVKELSRLLSSGRAVTGSEMQYPSSQLSTPGSKVPSRRSTVSGVTQFIALSTHDKQNTTNVCQLLQLAAYKLQPLKDTVPYEDLVKLRLEKMIRTSYLHLPQDGIDPTRREDYLTEAEFATVFGLEREKFKAMPAWKRQQKKKDVGLF